MIALGRTLVAAALVLAAGPQQEQREKPRELAVIVHEKNPLSDVSVRKLRAYFKLSSQFWPDRRGIELYLRPPRSNEMEILLERVYEPWTYQKLDDHWTFKINRGELTYRPRIVRSTKDALERVRKAAGAVTVVLADELPAETEGFKVLTLDRKRPGDPGYPLVAGKENGSEIE
jgi:hypothetical protein